MMKLDRSLVWEILDDSNPYPQTKKLGTVGAFFPYRGRLTIVLTNKEVSKLIRMIYVDKHIHEGEAISFKDFEVELT